MNNNDIPAFPVTHGDITYSGMMLRDYFAAKAMQSIIVKSNSCNIRHMSRCAYDQADSMLKQRDEPKK